MSHNHNKEILYSKINSILDIALGHPFSPDIIELLQAAKRAHARKYNTSTKEYELSIEKMINILCNKNDRDIKIQLKNDESIPIVEDNITYMGEPIERDMSLFWYAIDIRNAIEIYYKNEEFIMKVRTED